MILRSRSVFLLFVVLCFALSCHQEPKKSIPIILNLQKARLLFNNESNIMIFPCPSCGCFEPALNDAFLKDQTLFDEIYFLTDTNCHSTVIPPNHIDQIQLDSLSDELYNIVLIKALGDTYHVRIVESSENGKLRSIVRGFFNL